MHLSHGQLIGLAILAVFAAIVIADARWGIFSGHRTNQSKPREPLYQKDLDAAAEWDETQRTGPAVLRNLRQLHAARYGYVRRQDGRPVDVGPAAEPEPVPAAEPPLDPLPAQDERLWDGTMIGQQLHREHPDVEVPEPVLVPTAVMSREELIGDRVRAHYEELERHHWGWLNHEVEVAKRRSTEEWRGWAMLQMHAITA